MLLSRRVSETEDGGGGMGGFSGSGLQMEIYRVLVIVAMRPDHRDTERETERDREKEPERDRARNSCEQSLKIG